jgi:hypothetical protein
MYDLYKQVVFIRSLLYFHQLRLSKSGLYLQGGHYSTTVFNTDLTVNNLYAVFCPLKVIFNLIIRFGTLYLF